MDRILIWTRAKRWLSERVVAVGNEPPARNPEPLPWWHPRMTVERWIRENPGQPAPWIGFDPGSEEGDFSVESEWVKRPDEGEGRVAKIDIFPCENLREMIHRFQVAGAIREDIASQLVAQLERDGLWSNPYSHARQTVKSSAPSVTPDEIVDVLAWSCKRHKVEDVIPPSPPADRSVKGEPSPYGMPDLEYSAIGDKSEPNDPTVRGGLIQDFEYRIAKLERALGEERLARQLGEARIRSLIRIDARM